MMTMVVFAGFLVGSIIGYALGSWYRSKRECRACMRKFVEYGFHVDGKKYKIQEEEGF